MSHLSLPGEIETDAGSTSRELVAYEVPGKVNQILAQQVVEIFRADPLNPPEESLVQDRLIIPLEGLWGAKEVYKVLQSNPTVANFCGKVFKNGEPAIFCKDCQTDPTCCLCLECFEHSEHKNHNYKMFASGGGGCCDCGDPEAWTDHIYCTIHQPQKIDTDQVIDPISNLDTPLVECTQSFLSTVLWYCMNILTWEESRSVPSDISCSSIQSLLEKDKFITFLMNDEYHTYDEVITGLNRHIGLSHTDATDLATCVDRRGRGILAKGSEQNCLTAQTNVNKSLRHSPLGVKIYHEVVVKHQNCAIYLLNFLKELAEKSEGFCRLIAMVMAQPSLSASNQCLLDRYFLTDNSLWIEARLSWSRLIMNSIYKDFEYKKQLAISLATNYSRLAKNFIADSHHHDVCAMNLTVQLFTSPSLSRLLIADYGLLENVVSTIGDIVAPLYDGNRECLHLHSKDYKHDRIAYLLYDLRYLLRNKPEEWTDQLRIKTREGGSVFLNLLSSMENMDSVKRQTGMHIEREPHWENSFNFCIILTQSIKLFIDWCTSDSKVLVEILNLAVKRLADMSSSRMVYKNHAVDQNVMGRRYHELITFDIFKDRVSFHHPLPRLIAGLISGGASRYHISIPDLLRITASISSKTPLMMMEYSVRSIVLSSQVISGMWKRNGYGLLNQALHYQLHLSRGIMYDKDILMLQSMGAILDPNLLLYSLLYKYRLEKWFTDPQTGSHEWNSETREDALRFLLTEIEDLLSLVIVLYGERYQPGIGEGMGLLDPIRRELIHLLFLGPLPHSQIMKKFKMNEDDNAINRIIKEVAVLKKVSGKSVFELKEEHIDSYDPFYYHYSKTEQSKAEEVWRKRQKAYKHIRSKPEPPCLPPPFTPPYLPLLRLGHSTVLLKLLNNIFSEAAKDSSKLWSVRLLHQALHLSALILAEEHRLEENTFARLCLGMDSSKHPIITCLDQLLTSSTAKVEERHQLLKWVVQRLHEVRREITGCYSSLNFAAPTTEPTEDTDSAAKRSLIAEERRKKLMQNIADMQKKFFDEHKEELELIEKTNKAERQGSVASQTGCTLLCAVGMSAVQSHDQEAATCILCQETGNLDEQKAFVLSVCVQRSTALRRSDQDTSKVNFLSCRYDNKWGVFTGGCGHIMHADCWKKYCNEKQDEHRRRLFFSMRSTVIHWENGEYMCPLCQSFGNTILPLAVHPSCGPSYMPSRPLTITDTRALIGNVIKLGNDVASDVDDYTGIQPYDELTTTIQTLFAVHSDACQFKPIVKVKPKETTSGVPVVYVFTQQTFMQAYSEPPDDNSPKSPVAIWKNCLHTIAGLEHALREDGKFLLDSLSSRQMDVVCSLIQMSNSACDDLDTKGLAEFANELSLNLLPKFSAFSDHPSVLDMDVFTIVGNLRIILSALISRITSTESATNMFYPALIGLVDTCIVSVATAALVMQYLLYTQPTMETDAPLKEDQPQNESMEMDGVDSSPELAEGLQLQKLWSTLRSYALGGTKSSLSGGDTPPSPYSLLVGLQEHLYPSLQCLALFYHAITGIKFVHSSASEASNFSDLCTFLGLPRSLPSLFDDPCIQKIAKNFCTHPQVLNIVRGSESCSSDLVIFKPVRQLIQLPSSYSKLVSKASHFSCPRAAQLGGDETQASMLCLLCGEMICSNSYCCRKSVVGEETVQLGGMTHHTLSCGGGLGMALWILESYVVLINATDIHRVRGCTLTPPYIDEYGEPDPGLRRGNPLHLNMESYKILQGYWFNHQLPEQICKENEQNLRLSQLNWGLM